MRSIIADIIVKKRQLIVGIIYILIVFIVDLIQGEVYRPIVVAHQVLSSLLIFMIVYFYRGFRLKHMTSDWIIGLAFLFFAVADLIYGGTSDVTLNQESVTPLILVREFSYSIAIILLSIGLTWPYKKEQQINSTKVIFLLISTMIIALFCYELIILPFAGKADSVPVFIVNAFIYMLFRSYLISLTLLSLPTENSLPRFFLLTALCQMFIADIALTFQLDTLDAIKTPLDMWFEMAWDISLAVMAVIVFLNRDKEKIFSDSEYVGVKSIRFILVIFVLFAFLVLFAWFYTIGFISPLDVMNMTRVYSLGFGIWAIANIVSILTSRQILRLKESHYALSHNSGWSHSYEIGLILDYQRELLEELQKRRTMAALGKLASQIAHDIRSPLAALRAVVSQSAGIESQNRLILEKSAERIYSIAENLLHARKDGVPMVQLEEVSISDSINEIVGEKRLLYGGVEFRCEIVSCLATINATEFKRLISNLLNNSVEALDKLPKVITIRASTYQNIATISIADNGKGIPKDKIDQLFKEGSTFGKEKGNGLGLYHARLMIHSWGGEIELLSTEGVGTTVNIKLPIRSAPTASTMTILIDDDPLVRLVWESKAKSKGVDLKTYESVEVFEIDLLQINIESEIYIDRDLPNGIKGEEYAKSLFDKGFRNIILATGHERDFFGELPHIKKIIGKEAPW